MTTWAALDRFLRTDASDIGCDQAMDLLHVYADLISNPQLGQTRADRVNEASRRCPGVPQHLAACGPCGEDFEGLLAAVLTG